MGTKLRKSSVHGHHTCANVRFKILLLVFIFEYHCPLMMGIKLTYASAHGRLVKIEIGAWAPS
jgi:hypothetical protein